MITAVKGNSGVVCIAADFTTAAMMSEGIYPASAYNVEAYFQTRPTIVMCVAAPDQDAAQRAATAVLYRDGLIPYGWMFQAR